VVEAVSDEWDTLIAGTDAYHRQRCIEDPLFLAREVLGWAGHKAGIYKRNLFETPCVFHEEVGEVLKRDGNLLVLVPRIHLKTAFITVGGVIFSLLRDPNHRALIVSETPSLATKILREVKWHFQKNERLRAWFPEYRMDGGDEDGTQSHFDVPCRTGPKKDFSVEAIGIGGATAGGHFDSIRGSDILSDKTVVPMVTAETMAKTWHLFRAMGSLLDKTNRKAFIVLEGTVWSQGDAYTMLLNDPGYAHWDKVVHSAWADKAARRTLWPVVYSPEDLDRVRGEIGPYLFSCNWENDPQPDPEEAMFQPSYFKSYEYGEGQPGVVGVKPGECPCCRGALLNAVTVDPAIGKKKKNDRTAMTTSGVCPSGSLVVVSTRAQRVEPGVIITDLYDMDALDKPEWIGVETVAFQKFLLWALEEESKKDGRYPLPIWPLASDEQKERRISVLAAFARSRGIWVRPGDHDELVDECLKMTMSGTVGKHDDLPDALAYRLQYMNRPDAEALPEPPRPTGVLVCGASRISGAEVIGYLEDKAEEAAANQGLG
jgi:hypothetical protein